MSVFRFKQFAVAQEGVAMRINTDGVLLGAWVSLPQQTFAPKILDIGTGSGVIALMLAQRLCVSKVPQDFWVDALEPHLSSAQTAQKNFTNAPWSSQMRLFNHTLQDYIDHSKRAEYHLIVSNPPYFEDSLRPPESDRQWVRHADSLPYVDLVKGVAALLNPTGHFGVILPAAQQNRMVELSLQKGLFLRRKTLLYTLPERAPKRALMEFVKKEEPLQCNSLTLYKADGKSYTSEYKSLTADFYLAF